MQSALAALPKLDRLWHYPQATPEFRNRYMFLAIEPLFNLLHPALKLFPAVITALSLTRIGTRSQDLALPTRPGPNPAPTHPRIEVLLAVFARESRGEPLDTDLSLELLPPEGEAGPGIGGEVARLAARAEVAVDHEALGVELFEVHHARGHAT
ncbi:hypothetical protein RRF57_000009 [Xylaria bambusicola]|uniref:Uncharacterized protein n=1 Tax=Xylaria bambusicola TaxID=326684 RepID=A0AAN7U934_9PEZI